jgi:SNF2 family DNA or RNA helicase
VVYRFNHELERLREVFGKRTPSFADNIAVDRLQDMWNMGDIPVLLAQEGAMSHGLNMQGVEGHIIWYTLTTSNEKHSQLIRRVYRDGQKYPVVVHYLIANGTWDVRARSIIERKEAGQKSLLAALKEYWDEKPARTRH